MRDQKILHYLPGVLIYGSLAGFSVYLLWSGLTEFRNRGNRTAFIPFIILAVIVGGVWSWFGYFGDHGFFLIWPIVVFLAVIPLAIVWAIKEDRRRAEEALKIKQFPDPPKTGGPAQQSDFESWLK